jgi:hypothetical protein
MNKMDIHALKFGKQVPGETIELRIGVNTMVLQKLISLNNNFIQYFNAPYEEAFIEGNEVKIIYFQPTAMAIASYENLERINRLVMDCININSISKTDMAKANRLWKFLIEKSKKKNAS